MARLLSGILFLLVVYWAASSEWTWRALDVATDFLTQVIVDNVGS